MVSHLSHRQTYGQPSPGGALLKSEMGAYLLKNTDARQRPVPINIAYLARGAFADLLNRQALAEQLEEARARLHEVSSGFQPLRRTDYAVATLLVTALAAGAIMPACAPRAVGQKPAGAVDLNQPDSDDDAQAGTGPEPETKPIDLVAAVLQKFDVTVDAPFKTSPQTFGAYSQEGGFLGDLVLTALTPEAIESAFEKLQTENEAKKLNF